MAPEIISKKAYLGGPVDIWAVGVILYSLLVGDFPFKAKTESELFSKIRRGIVNIPDTLSYHSKKLLSKILVLDPSKRLTANEIYYDEWIQGKATSGRKMTLKMLNNDEFKNPLAHIISEDDSKPKSILFQQKEWRPKTKSCLANKRIDPDAHLKAIDKIRNLGFNYDEI
jgi:serine/threonine protein kinase